jgi:long-chain acyl-CoA synthetase
MSYRNLVELHRRQAERLGPVPALRYKRHGIYHDLSWEEYSARTVAAAAALVDVGVQIGDRVGLLAENSADWLVADMAILTAGAVNVPPHAPLTARQVQFQLHDAGVTWLIVSTAAQLEKIQQIRAELPALRGVVAFDRAAAGGDVLSWEGFLQRGRQALSRHAEELARREERLGADDLATIMYTSGTTGNPKGVMLTQGNLLSNALAITEVEDPAPDALVLNWLPYTHIYARTCDHYKSIASGITVALAESAETLVENLAEIEPTHLSSVPRFYEKVLTACADPDPARQARNLKKVFGPRIFWMSSGGAPLPLPVAQAYVAAGLPLYQGYGLTESSPVISFNHPRANKLGTVGQPIPGVEVRIAPDGEILTRGPHVMKGYWNNPAATAEAIRDGWLHTGDLGKLDEEGFLSITGRKKELLVLSNGKKVVPSYLEGLLLSDPCIDQAVVCGEGKSFLTALIVPHWANVRAALRERGVTADVEDRTPSPTVYDLLQERVRAALKDVSHLEQVKKFLVLPQPFSVAGDELTVSLKLRRNVVFHKYAEQIEQMYRE